MNYLTGSKPTGSKGTQSSRSPPEATNDKPKPIFALITELSDATTSMTDLKSTLDAILNVPYVRLPLAHVDQLLQAITDQLKAFWRRPEESPYTKQLFLDDLLKLLLRGPNYYPSFLVAVPEGTILDLLTAILPLVIIDRHYHTDTSKDLRSLFKCTDALQFFGKCSMIWPDMTTLICTGLRLFEELNFARPLNFTNRFPDSYKLSDTEVKNALIQAFDGELGIWTKVDPIESLQVELILAECTNLMQGYSGNGIFTQNLVPLERAKQLVQTIAQSLGTEKIWSKLVPIITALSSTNPKCKSKSIKSFFIANYLESIGFPHESKTFVLVKKAAADASPIQEQKKEEDDETKDQQELALWW